MKVVSGAADSSCVGGRGSGWMLCVLCVSCSMGLAGACLVVPVLSCLPCRACHVVLVARLRSANYLPQTPDAKRASRPSVWLRGSTFAHVGSRGRGHPRRSPPGGLPGALPTSVRDDVPRLPRPFRRRWRRWRRRRAATSLPANHGGDGAALTLTTQPQPHLSPSPSPLPSPSPSPG